VATSATKLFKNESKDYKICSCSSSPVINEGAKNRYETQIQNISYTTNCLISYFCTL
jgi:hypothetical protein